MSENRLQYTIHKASNGDDLILKGTGVNSESKIIEPGHSRYEWVKKNQGRVVNISTTNGRWNSSTDYNGAYEPYSKEITKDTKVTLTKLDDLNIDSSLFINMKTDTVFDEFCSSDGGFAPGTNVMFTGSPGIGKTTVGIELLSKLQDAGKKVLFISAEMSQIDMARYLKRFPHWGQLPILFLGDHTDSCPKSVIESVLNEGWDLILTDSYTEVNDTVKEECGLTRSKTEKWFLDLMITHNKGGNNLKKYTTFVTILQLNKGGQFVGSNKLRHMTSAMLNLRWDGEENTGRRYMEFDKNRVGAVGKKLFFTLDAGVSFDENRFNRDKQTDLLVEDERKQLDAEGVAFDDIFGLDAESYTDEDKEEEAYINDIKLEDKEIQMEKDVKNGLYGETV
jgi:predicted ATP-dependent serine protease